MLNRTIGLCVKPQMLSHQRTQSIPCKLRIAPEALAVSTRRLVSLGDTSVVFLSSCVWRPFIELYIGGEYRVPRSRGRLAA